MLSLSGHAYLHAETGTSAPTHRVSKEKAELQKAELEAVLDCTRDPEVELQIENAREMRKVLLDRLRQHLAEHAC